MTETSVGQVAGNPLVATPEATPPLEGAGLLSDLHKMWTVSAQAFEGGEFDIGKVDLAEAGYTAASAATSALGVVKDPLSALGEAGLGWLIEHISFLREPLDQLAGNPQEITAHEKTWRNIGVELAAVAAERDRQVSGLTCWTGSAAEGYQAAATRHNDALRHAAEQAAKLAELIKKAGGLIGTVRGVIRNTIASFIARLISWAVAALASAPATGGASLAPLISAVIAQAVELATYLAQVIARLLELLDELALTMQSCTQSAAQRADSVAGEPNGALSGTGSSDPAAPVAGGSGSDTSVPVGVPA